ncbi:hypothetical protein RSAG8_05374, partial [Rhizoctonia solani AG-8 WAC10335]
MSLSKLTFLVGVLALVAGSAAERNDSIKLVIGPTCGKLTATGNATDANRGLRNLREYKTIVSFGDSYTAGGVKDGSPLAPPVITPPSPKAGGRTTNGPVWIENIANDIGARFMDYAVGGAVTDRILWPSKASNWDFVQEADIFLSQNNTLDSSTALYTVYFGIKCAYLRITDVRAHPRMRDREGFKKKVFNGITEMKSRVPSMRFGFVDFAYLWDAVRGPTPGYAAFGYTSIGSCTLNSSTIEGACNDPDHTFYWIPNHPSKQTHRIMADYVEAALEKCH